METYIGHLLTAAVMLAGLVGVYVSLRVELTEIKTTLLIAEKAKADRTAARKLEVNQAIRDYCRHECPNREPTGVTNQGGF